MVRGGTIARWRRDKGICKICQKCKALKPPLNVLCWACAERAVVARIHREVNLKAGPPKCR
jgi:hypothetical protein